ncbi:MAG: restriction endonuclease subunit S, partial [Cyanobacteria bacterium J06559_3]
LYFLLRTDEYRHEVLASSSGTTVKHTSPQKIKAFKFPCPDPSILQNFEEKVLALHQKLEANADESASLTSVRDTLLPKLLSGEIRVKEAVQALEAVA